MSKTAQAKFKVGVVGGSGLTGAELLRILAVHPNFELEYVTANKEVGTSIADLYQALGANYKGWTFEAWDITRAEECDIVFFCLPHGASQDLIAQCDKVRFIVDLGSDFRHDDPKVYDEYYGEAHHHPELLKNFVYGLPELYRTEIEASTRVAAPGCYPTASILAIKPFVDAGIIEEELIIVNADSGMSGAGKDPKPNTTYVSANENAGAYGLLVHRHTPEMQTHLGSTVLFTPHLIPVNRGIMVTAYGKLKRDISQDEVNQILNNFYEGETFVQVLNVPPQLASVKGSNNVQVFATPDVRTGQLVMLSVIDNLCKGSSGQAVQCANLMTELPEDSGLKGLGLYP